MEKIGNVILNDTYYNEKYDYRDTTIEDQLLKYISQKKDPLTILSQDNRWPILYHISPMRKNIIDWCIFDSQADILEIGSECGILTEELCKKGKTVTCIEVSKKKSVVNALRNQKCSNLEIIVGSFSSIKIEKKFDYIILIGGLEYSQYYKNVEKSAVVFLQELGSFLKPNGKILLAVQNKFGLKYWAGAPEDHTGKLFDSIEGYAATKEKVNSFSKQELEKIIFDAGYNFERFYYPFPDYIFMQQIFSDEYLPKEDELVCSLDSFHYDKVQLFDETSAFRNIINANQFQFFSNSFFVEITPNY